MTNDSAEIITVDTTNVEEYGFFCYKSKPKSQGYQKKLHWLRQRFAEGLRFKILYEGSRSVEFIEYIPGEHSWRVDAVHQAVDEFAARGIEAKAVRLESSAEVRAKSPTAYGVSGIVCDGRLLTYHSLTAYTSLVDTVLISCGCTQGRSNSCASVTGRASSSPVSAMVPGF